MPDPDPTQLISALIQLVEAQLAEAWSELRDQNTYALTLAGFGVAVIGIIVAAQTPLGTHWWVPIPGLALATAVALFGTRRAHTDLGPQAASFYSAFGTAAPQDALAQLLADLLATQRKVPATLRTQRIALLSVGLLFLLTAVYSTLILV